jgi:tetratricopeptide (TPR) repeat protein
MMHITYGEIFHFILGKNQLAIDDFTKAIQINSTCADYFNNRGSVYNKIGYYKLAIKDYDEAILFDSNDAAYYNNRGSVHLNTVTKR